MGRLASLFTTGLLTLLVAVHGVYADHWVQTWGSMPQLTEPHNLPPAPYNETGLVFRNTTLRQTVRATIGGDWLRIRISNAFGVSDLPITAVSIALPTKGSAGVPTIQPRTSRKVTFSGESSFIVPNGAQVLSDPIRFSTPPQSMLSITIYTAQGQTTNYITSHPGSRTTSWMARGNQVDALDLESLGEDERASTNHWYWVSSVETWADDNVGSLVIVGDSITDGRGSNDNNNDRWPDLLLARLQSSRQTRDIAVINQAAGGNRILYDGLGPNALGRIDRDVLAHPGVKYAMIYEGVNDIGTGATTEEAQKIIGDRMIWAYRQMVERLHTSGIPVIGATITPMSGPGQGYGHPTREATRQRVNRWIRTSGVFDAVIDFDRVVRDPEIPEQLKPEYDTGDYLHPNVAGFQAMADAIPLDLFRRLDRLGRGRGGRVPPGVRDL
ncbi:lipolytic enzyme [Coprinopsis cinerea okayama7|uniref:Lipolytic enzyme n=1 Tax=Coprinopsis cinerea (strain Okayama-7 / 130 / ATCC MYA-4618 / FGSC 9003) TaxID=240176 RepID=A8N875_COPC7|nr:lipolytic enzyme [Coprinopsis cinerea okayama7\|eukprot:XP_001831031.1 lipolytic enzyme [Coprinopsis cinerea okayama7\